MKKFFTLTIAAFASLGLFAADKVIALSDLSVLGNTYTYDGSEVKAKNNNVYVELPAADTKGNFTVYGSSDKNDRFLYIYGEHGTVKDESRSMVMAAAGVTIQYSAEDVILVEEKPYLLFSTADDFKFKKFEYTAEGVAPAENPVSTVTIEGPTEGNVGQTVTLKATFDVQPDTIFWTVDGAVQESHTATLKVELVAERTYQIGCWARNQYNAAEDWIIGEHSVVATAKAVLPQEDVTEATVWDWTKAGEGSIKWTAETSPAKDVDTVLLANVDGINNNADFHAQALLFAGEYPIRDGKYAQGPFFSFNTTVPGWVVVEFSNTGTKTDPRYVSINGVVNTEVGTLNTEKKVSAAIEVPAGKVVLQGAFEDGTTQYLRVYKLTFATEKPDPQGIEDLEASEQAVKFIQDGQILIRRGEKIFTVTGQEK